MSEPPIFAFYDENLSLEELYHAVTRTLEQGISPEFRKILDMCSSIVSTEKSTDSAFVQFYREYTGISEPIVDAAGADADVPVQKDDPTSGDAEVCSSD